jgi:glutathione S-transferase
MKLYYTKGACSLATRIVINELGLTCEYESVDLRTKKSETGMNYYTINSKGAVPALLLNNGEVLTENSIIMQYLADTSKENSLLPSINDFNRYRVLEWLNYMATELHKSLGLLFNSQLSQEIKDQTIIPIIKAKLDHVNHHLESNKCLIGNHFTLPDAYLFVMASWARYLKFNLNEWPSLANYVTELSKRPSIVDSIKEEGLEMITT